MKIPVELLLVLLTNLLSVDATYRDAHGRRSDGFRIDDARFDGQHSHRRGRRCRKQFRNYPSYEYGGYGRHGGYDLCRVVNQCNKFRKPESCLDIYRQDCRSPSGEYVLYQGYSAIKVYCSFERDVIGDTAYGYTFISRRSSMESFDIRSLYTTSKFAKLRSLDLTNNQQTDVIVENHSAYSEFDLSFTINGNQNYKGPLETNNGLHPYIFLGFLPKSQSSKNTDQGFRAAGTDYTFTNCDSEPNSYIAFYFDPNIGTWGHNEESNPNFMQNWIRQSKSIAYPYHMDGAFYMHWEMQMGGSCGGFQTSSTINKKAAVGLPFALPPSKCYDRSCE